MPASIKRIFQSIEFKISEIDRVPMNKYITTVETVAHNLYFGNTIITTYMRIKIISEVNIFYVFTSFPELK